LTAAVEFDVWGSRGSRNLIPARSAIGNRTSCYSLLAGDELLIFDAGSGLAALGHAMRTEKRFRKVRRVHLFVSHAHMDHWEGLKDVEWFWSKDVPVDVKLYGSKETVRAIEGAFRPPRYVPLERLASAAASHFEVVTRKAGDQWAAGRFRARAFHLHHYSGDSARPRRLATLGYAVTLNGGPGVAYLSDHEPTARTAGVEARAGREANLMVLDAHFPDRRDHAFGHGSQEHAASLAAGNPKTLVLAGHLAPSLSDERLEEARLRHGGKLSNLALAVEGRTWGWDAARGRFVAGARPKKAAVKRSAG
jgi:phosphoribosyl 1,2-cyclic phosphodiesterase